MDFYNDTFIEYLITKKKTNTDYLLNVLAIFGGVIFTLLMLVVSMVLSQWLPGIGSGIGFLLMALGWYGVYLLITNRNIEFEYILTNSAMEIDKVMSKKGRKHVTEWDFKEIEICACVDDPMHKAEYENNQSIQKTYNLTGDSKLGNVYFVDFSKDGVKTRVLFQPTTKIIETAKRYNMRRVFIME